MKVQGSNNINFKGIYKINGAQDALSEVCWYLKKVAKKEGSDFDFVQIRLQKQQAKKSELDIFLKSGSEQLVRSPEEIADMIESAMGKSFLINKPKNVVANNVDLILTNPDKKKFDKITTPIIEDNVNHSLRFVSSLQEKIMRMVNQIADYRTEIESKKPIVSLEPSLVLNHLENIGILPKKAKTTPATEVLKQLKKDSFDIVTGEPKIII